MYAEINEGKSEYTPNGNKRPLPAPYSPLPKQ